ncbi:MAG: hypothetical protein C0501_24790 [Isosphaera sp.]|nr:hypothetical protein [Isosphaera sp.]
MARVQLYLQPAKGFPTFDFLRPGGRPDSIPALRLQVFVDLSVRIRPGQPDTKAAYPECVLDTAAHLTTLPEYIWGQFLPGVVTPLPFDPAMPRSRRRVAMVGGSWHYDLGELTITLRDQAGGAMDVTVVAQLTRDGGRLTIPMVLGLRGGVLDGRVLRAEPDPAAPHGQRWTLEDP